MADNGKKPNNELFELNDILAGVEASDESLEDILAEIYGTTPASHPAPAVSEDVPPADVPAVETADAEPAAEEDPADAEPPAAEEPSAAESAAEAIPELEPIRTTPRRKKTSLFSRRERISGEEDDTPVEPEEDSVPPAEPEPAEDAVPEEETPSAWEADSDDVVPSDPLDEDAARPDGTPEDQRRRPVEGAPVVEEDYRASRSKKKPKTRLRSRANAFADEMFSQALTEDSEIELAEQYIPGTDEEYVPEERTRFHLNLRLPHRAIPEFEDTAPEQLVHTYHKGLTALQRRTLIVLLLALAGCYLVIAPETPLPLPGILADSSRLSAIIELALLGGSIAASYDVIWSHIKMLREWFFGIGTVAVLSVLVTVVDAVTFILLNRPGSAPYCVPANLILLGLMWGTYDKKKANYIACRQAAQVQEPISITKDPALWSARDTFTKEKVRVEGFGAQIQSPDISILQQSIFAPFILIASVVLTLIAVIVNQKPAEVLWILSAITIAASPLSAILCSAQPWYRLTKRLEKAGSAVAGWDGAENCFGKCGVLLTDEDFFASGHVKLNGYRVLNNNPREKVIGCTASMIRASGSGLTELFDGLVRTNGGFYRRVDDFHCYEAGGLSGKIRDDEILVGSAGFMTVMDIKMPKGLKVKAGVFCAINGELCGIFALNYGKDESVRPSIQSLLRSKLIPIIAPRDFNITPSGLKQKFKAPVERMEYPPVERRMELTEPGQEHGVLCAVMKQDGIETYSETLVGCRRLRSAIHISSTLTILASIAGLLLSFYLTLSGSVGALIPFNMTMFLLLWLIPALLISGNVNRY